MIVVLNTGEANLSSVIFALDRLGKKSILSKDPEVIKKASHVIFPGVGTAHNAMKKIINDQELFDCLTKLKQPVLGICLGMQILFKSSTETSPKEISKKSSDEEEINCLNILPAKVKKMTFFNNFYIPHMGWNKVIYCTRPSIICKNIPDENYFYFVHSYIGEMGEWTKAISLHGQEFPVIIEKDNYFGTQFHPERSGKLGQIFLKNFTNL